MVKITFPGKKKVEASVREFTVTTDQSKVNGGEETAPTPLDMLWVSISSCAGLSAYLFCVNKDIDTKGLSLELDGVKNEESKKYETVTINLTLPKNFPEKYKSAIERVVDTCTVKKYIMSPPEFKVVLR